MEAAKKAAVAPMNMVSKGASYATGAAKKMNLLAARKKDLSPEQIALKTDEAKQNSIKRLLQFLFFCDIGCSVLLKANFSYILANAEGGIPSYREKYPGMALPASQVGGVGFTVAVTMMGCVESGGKALCNLLWPGLSDKIGRKPVILICQFGNVVGMIMAYCFGSPDVAPSFIGMIFTQVWLGFFGGSLPVINAYIGDMFPTDPQKKQSFFMSVAMVSLVGMNAAIALGHR